MSNSKSISYSRQFDVSKYMLDLIVSIGVTILVAIIVQFLTFTKISLIILSALIAFITYENFYEKCDRAS